MWNNYTYKEAEQDKRQLDQVVTLEEGARIREEELAVFKCDFST